MPNRKRRIRININSNLYLTKYSFFIILIIDVLLRHHTIIKGRNKQWDFLIT